MTARPYLSCWEIGPPRVTSAVFGRSTSPEMAKYRLIQKVGQSTSSDREAFDICVAHLGGYLFFDATFQRVQTDGETAVFSEDELWIPLHLIGRLEVKDDALHFLLLADDWLQDELKSGRLHLTSTQDDEDNYLLAAPSKELKEFAGHFAADSRAFSYAEDFELVPEAGSTSQHQKSNPKAAVYGGKLPTHPCLWRITELSQN